MKKSYVFLFGLLFLFSPSVSAHTGLESSSPADGDTVKEQIQDISLTFETGIEEGSSFTLRGESGDVPVRNVKAAENVLSGSATEPLENGSYTVDWRIVGEDGHLIEGTYGFAVLADQTPEPTEAPEVTEEEAEMTEAAEEAPVNVQEKNESPVIMPIVLGAILAAALAVVIILVRKGK